MAKKTMGETKTFIGVKQKRAIERQVSSDFHTARSRVADYASYRKKDTPSTDLAEFEEKRQEFGVFLEIRNGVICECDLHHGVDYTLLKGEAVYFSKPLIYNAAKLLYMVVTEYDPKAKTAIMTNEDGYKALYDVRFIKSNNLPLMKIQRQKTA